MVEGAACGAEASRLAHCLFLYNLLIFTFFYLFFFFFKKIYLFIYLTALGLLAACGLSLVVVVLRHVGS